jgi:hypothetical protein
MGFMGLFKRKKARGNSFQDAEVQAEAAKRSLEIREINHNIRLAEHERELAKARYNLKRTQDDIRFYNEEQNGDDEEEKSPLDGMLTMLLMKAFGVNVGMPQQVTNPPLTINTPINSTVAMLSDDEIRQQIAAIPKQYRKIGKNMPDTTLQSFLKKQTAFDDDTITRAIQIFRTEKL